MAISIATNFDVLTTLPIDARYAVSDEAERIAIPNGQRYDGLSVYQRDTNVTWQLQGGIVTWVDISSGVSSDVDGGNWT
jgi:hypothetical protein